MRAAVAFVTLAFVFVMEGTRDANAASKLPDPITAGVAERLYTVNVSYTPGNQNINHD